MILIWKDHFAFDEIETGQPIATRFVDKVEQLTGKSSARTKCGFCLEST